MEEHHHQSPIFGIHSSAIIRRSSVVVQVYTDPGDEYQIEGSYPLRCCTIYYTSSSKERVAEIKGKVEPMTNRTLGKDVFWLFLKPAFAMGLLLVLDQMYGDDEGDGVGLQEVNMGATTEDSSS